MTALSRRISIGRIQVTDAGGQDVQRARTRRNHRRLFAVVAADMFLSVLFPAGQAVAAGNPPTHGLPPGHEAAEAGRWAFAIAAGFLVIGLPLLAWVLRSAWWATTGRRTGSGMPKLLWGRSLVIGTDNRVSTSKTAALVWTYTLAAALASSVIAEWLGHPGGIGKLTHQGLDAKYALLIGGPIGAAILAKSIVSAQVASGEASKSEAESATPAQLVQNDARRTSVTSNICCSTPSPCCSSTERFCALHRAACQRSPMSSWGSRASRRRAT